MSIADLNARLVECRRCPRLVEWREHVADAKRAAYADEDYWGRPVPGFGDPAARLLIVGLAPAAHGANRTGRMFTGDRSGDWLFRSLHRTGFASRPISDRLDDGLKLDDVYVTSIVHCAPPANKPTATERATCRSWLEAELVALPSVHTIVALGAMAYQQTTRVVAARGWKIPRPRPRFGHGVSWKAGEHGPTMIASYHPSQQNTFTGRLTEDMLDAVFGAARRCLSGP